MNVHSLLFISTLMTPDNKRQLIFSATEQIIATEGLHGLSMQKVATEANVAAGTIYRYFKDKDELISELRKYILTQVAAHVLKDCDLGSFEQRFKRLWFNIINFCSKRTNTNLSYEQYIHLPSLDTAEQQEFDNETFAPLFDFFIQGQEAGVFHKLQVKTLFSISLEPALALGRGVRRGQLEYDKNELDNACNLCWQTLLINKEHL